MAGLRLASNLVPFARLSDRFVPSGYRQGHSFERQMEMLSSIEGITGVALGYPHPAAKNGKALKKLAENHGLSWALSDADIYTEERFKNGSLSNRDPKIRAAAIARIKEAIDGSAEGGVETMNLWLGHDGFDYSFQSDYDNAWRWILEGLETIADYSTSPLIICLEPKRKEPRSNTHLADTGVALFVLAKLNRPNLGLTLDYGHSLAALENPAEAAVMAMRENRLKQIHINDNRREWDLDLVPGSATVWEHIEFYYWLQRMKYTGWLSTDIYPWREDGIEVLRRTVQVHRKCEAAAKHLAAMDAKTIIRNGKHMEMMKLLWDMVQPS